MSSADATRSHPAPEVLAGLDDELLPPEHAAEVRQHLEGCRDCRTSLVRLGQVREALAAGQERMPADVVARVGAAVHTAGSARRAGQARRAAAAAAIPATAGSSAAGGADAVGAAAGWHGERAGGSIRLPPPAAAGRSRPRGWAVAAAAAVVLVLGVTLAAGLLRSTGTGSKSAASGAAAGSAAVAARPVTESGRDYTPATVAAGVGVRAGTDARKATADAGVKAPLSLSGDSPLRSRAALARCVAELAGRPGVAPIRVDLAAFQHEPAAVIVLPVLNHPGRVQVWVVGPYCTTGAPDIRYFVPGVPRAR